MGRYRKKPVVVDAVQYAGEGNLIDGDDIPPWMFEALEKGVLLPTNGGDPLFCKTKEGDMEVCVGDFIIRGVKGELYPCKPDIFEMTYDKEPDDG